MAVSLLDLPGTTRIYHRIETGDAAPIRQRQYRMSEQEKAEISRQTKEMLAAGIIERSESAWSSPSLLVRKSNGEFRWCIDFRKVNSKTALASWPLPTLTDIIDTVAESKCTLWSSLDLFSGYWQVPLEESTKDRSAFHTHEGSFQFCRLPFGLCNAPVTFQRLMEKVLRSMPLSTSIYYLDDVLLLARDSHHMLEVLQEAFNRFRFSNLRIRASKCHWAVNRVRYLGHIFEPAGISTDPQKLEIVRKFPRPTTAKGVKSFLGLAGYYRKFVKGFARISGRSGYF